MSHVIKDSTLKRFEEKFEKGRLNECWNWKASTNHGYGQLKIENINSSTGAHRVAWELYNNKKIPKGKEICHHCDNKKCVNPRHLFIGTHLDNMKDRDRKGHNVISIGEKNGNHKLTARMVREIRKSNEPSIFLGKVYGVNHSTICNVRNRKYWKHIK
jgi:hypothetical protein